LLLSEEKCFVFVHVQKTGGSTLSRLLEEAVPDARGVNPRHMTLGEAIERERIPQDYFAFAFVRNPWDRLASWYSMIDRARRKRLDWETASVQRRRFRQNPLYRYVLRQALTFDDFVKNCAQPRVVDGVPYSFAKNQYDYLTGRDGRMLADFVGRFEDLERDVGRLFEALGLPAPKVPRKNRTHRRHYSKLYTPETEEIVRQRFRRDIEAFGYVFERAPTYHSADFAY
jgi:hypothetical protein